MVSGKTAVIALGEMPFPPLVIAIFMTNLPALGSQ